MGEQVGFQEVVTPRSAFYGPSPNWKVIHHVAHRGGP